MFNLKKIRDYHILSSFPFIVVWDIAKFFFQGLVNGAITTRASAIAFNFFLAVFPMMLFLFSLIPYVPIANFQEELLALLKEVMPENVFLATEETITQVILKQHFDLLSVGFVSMLIFATNGMNSLLSALGATYHSFKSRTWVSQYVVSLFLIVVVAVFIIAAVAVVVLSKYSLRKMQTSGFLNEDFTYYLSMAGSWGVVVVLIYMAVAIIYYFAPNQRGTFRFFSSGALLTTVFLFLFSFLFSFYINNFGQYNKLYGSIGTVIVVLLWFYLNAFSLLLGFELNLSVFGVKKTKV